MQYLCAAQRLVDSGLHASVVEAQFDATRVAELRAVQERLRKHGLIFSAGMHHLFHKSNDHEIVSEATQTAAVLNAMGYGLRVIPGIYQKPSFALKGREGIILQKVQTSLRIFFSV